LAYYLGQDGKPGEILRRHKGVVDRKVNGH